MLVDLQQLSAGQVYHTLTQSLIPRPIAWIVTQNADGDFNVAPFSYFTAIASEPPLLAVSIGNKAPNMPKDTAKNLQTNGQCVVHIASAKQIESLNETARALDYGDSEVTGANIELVEEQGFALPRIKGAPIAMAAKVFEQHNIGQAPQHVFYLEVDKIFVDDSVAQKDEKGRLSLDAKAINPLARLGASEYSQLGELVIKKRPS